MSNSITVTLPWPTPKLSPNARIHWAQLSKAKSEYRRACFALCREAGLKAGVFGNADEITLTLEFVPPTRARRDADNCLASMKAGIDGISDALQLDDCRFVFRPMLVKDRIGGYVVARLEVA